MLRCLTAIPVFAVLILMTGCAQYGFVWNPDREDTMFGPQKGVDPRLGYALERFQHIVSFEYDSAVLDRDAPYVIEPHVRHMEKNPDIKVAIQGSGSIEGTAKYNYELGLERANAVKKVMVELGVAEERVVVLSIGENRINGFPARSAVITY